MNRFVFSSVLAFLAVFSYIAPVVSAEYNWTGLYVGANGGAAWNRSEWNGTQADDDTAGAMVGGQIGYNYQIKKLILGVEGDIDAAYVNNTGLCPGVANSS